MVKSKFFNDRKSKLDMVVIHCSALSKNDLIDTLNNLELSCHYIIDEKGDVVHFVDDDKRAWHAGVSFWRDHESDLNSSSIGIELCNLSLGQEDYTVPQINALKVLLKDIVKKHNIPAVNIVAHSDIAPFRKSDPGAAFPWKELADDGIGLWFDDMVAKDLENSSMKELLSVIGYDVRSDEVVVASSYAFCRRYLTKFVAKVDDVMKLCEEVGNQIYDNVFDKNFDGSSNVEFMDTLRKVATKYKS